MSPLQPRGMKAFTLLWFGQVISLIGSAMTGFALTIWAWEFTGSATALSLVAFFNFAPTVLFSPVAGALVDRWNRKWVMALSDLATGLTTVAILILYSLGDLQIWHLYVTGAIAGLFQAFQWPAYSAAISLMIPREQYARASGMMSLAEWGSGVFSPVLAGMLIGLLGSQQGVVTIMLIDVATFVLALLALGIIHVPTPPRTSEGKEGAGNLWQESLYGFRYILKRRGLLGMQLIFFFNNLMASISGILVSPMILARTASNAALLGAVQSAGAVGGIAGSGLVTAWGGPKNKVRGVIFGWIGTGMLGYLLMGIGRGLPLWIIGSFFNSLFGPIVNASNQAIWQSKVAPDVQGRVFAVRRMIAQITAPLGLLIAGPLADRVFEPAMTTGVGGLSALLGGVFGRTAGAGMGVMLAMCALTILVISLVAYSTATIRNVESDLPDHVQAAEMA